MIQSIDIRIGANLIKFAPAHITVFLSFSYIIS